MAEPVGLEPPSSDIPSTQPSVTKSRANTETAEGKRPASKKSHRVTEITEAKHNKQTDDFVTRQEFTDMQAEMKRMSSSVTTMTSLMSQFVAINAPSTSQKGTCDHSEAALSDDNEDDQNETQDAGPSTSQTQSQRDGDLDSDFSYFQEVAGVQEESGPDINPNLAKGVAQVLRIGLSEENRSKLENKYPVPANCPRLAVVPCNDAIFKNVKKGTRMNDVQLQKIQKDITKSITAIAESYVNSKDEKLADAISLASHTSHALDVFRFYNISNCPIIFSFLH